MFAVIKTGGKQYKVRVGETIDVEKLAAATGTQVQLDQVLLAANDGDVAYGRPLIDGAVVTARVVRQHKGPKLIVFRYKSKSRYRRRTGHRQQMTQLVIQRIDVPGWEAPTVEAARAPVPVAATETAPVVAEAALPPAVVPSASSETVAPAVDAETPAGPAPEAQAWGAVVTPDVQAAPAEVQGAAGAVAEGSAAPVADILPVVNPAAQLERADSGALDPATGAGVGELPSDLPGTGGPAADLPAPGQDIE